MVKDIVMASRLDLNGKMKDKIEPKEDLSVIKWGDGALRFNVLPPPYSKAMLAEARAGQVWDKGDSPYEAIVRSA